VHQKSASKKPNFIKGAAMMQMFVFIFATQFLITDYPQP